jgi:lysophospholipase L1-like esterase
MFGFVGLASLLVLSTPAPFALKDGDRVVLLGSALIEHEQFHGYLETNLLCRSRARGITIRNLGWSGDTVRGNARTSGYQNPEGLARLLREVKQLQPTVLFIGYGMNESFAGKDGLADFLKGYRALLDELAPLKARIVILSPTPHEDLGRPLPDPAEHNRHLELYTDALGKLADERGARFVDLFHPLRESSQRPLTTNGIQLNQAGYQAVAAAIVRQLALSEMHSDASSTEKLRQAIVHRDELFLRRWRPFNDHSRHWGFMAKDFQLYDDEVTAADRVIEQIRANWTEEK